LHSPTSPLLPYTTLFRSSRREAAGRSHHVDNTTLSVSPVEAGPVDGNSVDAGPVDTARAGTDVTDLVTVVSTGLPRSSIGCLRARATKERCDDRHPTADRGHQVDPR